jgi:ATP-dependent Clp protease ATP-binding subunit ClpB
MGTLREEQVITTEQWEEEKHVINGLKALRTQLETARKELETCERKNELERAGELKYSVIPQMEIELHDMEQNLGELNGGSLLHDAIDESEIAEVVSRWTGIPVDRMTQEESEKILNLDKELHKRLIGQNEAVQLVTEAMIRSRSGIKDPARPIGSFIFLGPTGVGKTELAKALAESMFDTEQNIIRVDMSEYMEKHSVSRMLGAPPGYVGFEDGGQLTEAVRRKPFSVILFDEIEKAHPDVFNVLLQILDDGRATDGHGRTVNFKNTVIIMTSNVGSQYLLTGIGKDGEIKESARDKVFDELKSGFRPEFLNRVDDIVLFKPLSRDNIKVIVDLLLNDIRKRLEDRDIALDITEEAKQYVADVAYDPIYGARPLKRYLSGALETQSGKALLSGQIKNGMTITVTADENGLIVQ